MREIQLQTEIVSFEGEPFQLADQGLEHMRVGNVLVRQLALAKSEGEAVFLTPEIGRKLVAAMKAGEALLLETADFSHLQAAVKQNNAQFVDLVQAQALQALKDALEVEVAKV